MVKAAYEIGKKVYVKEVGRMNAKYEVNRISGMETGSAQDYITVLLAMLDGEEYHRTMNAFATEYYLENIGHDYGRARQIAAAKAVKAHTEYYATLGHGHQVAIEKLAVKYM